MCPSCYATIRSETRPPKAARRLWGVCYLVAMLLAIGRWSPRSVSYAEPAQELSVIALQKMALEGEGQLAIEIIALEARRRGAWAPAIGDRVVYDEKLAFPTRGVVLVVDVPPAECGMPLGINSTPSVCQIDLTTRQNQIRFGFALFMDAADHSHLTAADDLLAVYIEEMGHSWQEYMWETDGRLDGERHITTWEEDAQLRRGWEYQAKRYLLSLDGTWLALSTGERALLVGQICAPDGYANPKGWLYPPYGPPPGWPNPTGWITAKPDAETVQAFCDEAYMELATRAGR